MEVSQWILSVILAAGGYDEIYRAVRQMADGRRSQKNQPALAGILLVIYLCLVGVLLLGMGDADPAFRMIGILIFFFMITLVTRLMTYRQYVQRIHRKWLLLTLAFDAFLLVMTVAGRTERTNTEVLMVPLHSIGHAIYTHRMTSVIHMSLNAVMFLPEGFFAGGIIPGVTDVFPEAVLSGMMMSTLIEMLQLILKRGQCDIDDIIANAAGAGLGMLIYRALYKRRR